MRHRGSMDALPRPGARACASASSLRGALRAWQGLQQRDRRATRQPHPDCSPQCSDPNAARFPEGCALLASGASQQPKTFAQVAPSVWGHRACCPGRGRASRTPWQGSCPWSRAGVYSQCSSVHLKSPMASKVTKPCYPSHCKFYGC